MIRYDPTLVDLTCTVKPRYSHTNGKREFWRYNDFGYRSRSGFLSVTCLHSKTRMRYGEKNAFSQELTIPHLESCISHFELWVASIIWLVSFNSRAPVGTQFIVKNRKKSNFES